MKMRFVITACALLFNCLPSKHPSIVDGRMIVLPDFDDEKVQKCEDNDCEKYLRIIRDYAVHTLNTERSELSKGMRGKMPNATNMLYLERDTRRENDAQLYAEQCVMQPGIAKCPLGGRNHDGEVIVFVNYHNIDTLLRKIKENPGRNEAFAGDRFADAAMNWTNQIKNVEEQDIREIVASYNTAEKREGLQFVAKVFHASVWKVGCGIADNYINRYEFKEVIACFFGPPKLRNSEVLYIPGCKPCTLCPSGTTCVRVKEREYPITDSLCKVESRNKIFPNNYNMPEDVCPNNYNISKDRGTTIPNKPVEILLDAVQNGVQACTGTPVCSPGWIHYKGYSKILVKEECTSAVMFREKIPIHNESCFQFVFYKTTNTNKTLSEVAAFAFQANNIEKRIKTVVTEENARTIALNVPWSNVDIYTTRTIFSFTWVGNSATDRMANSLLREFCRQFLQYGCDR